MDVNERVPLADRKGIFRGKRNEEKQIALEFNIDHLNARN